MPFCYVAPPNSGPLRQGEILGNVWEHRPTYPPIELAEDAEIEVDPINHPRLIVMNPDCDLHWDHESRERMSDGSEPPSEREHSRLLYHVLLCEMYEASEIQERVPASHLWQRIDQNQDERYHHLPAGTVSTSPASDLPDLFLDFKKNLSLPIDRVYEAIERNGIVRVAVVPPIFLHDLMHRFYSFMGRVALP